MKELSKFDLAGIKRTASSTKRFRDQRARILLKISALNEELDTVEKCIDAWENPIKLLTGGYTSEQVLNGEMEKMEALKGAKEVELPEDNNFITPRASLAGRYEDNMV